MPFVKKISILGGGTSGLLTALILKKSNPLFDITLIKSLEIDIVGVGEGSTEHWATFMKYIGVHPIEIFKKTDATFKYGIKFNNWNGDGKSYMHAVVAEMLKETATAHPYLYHKSIVDNKDPNNVINDFIHNSQHYQPVGFSTNQFHFDTFKLNQFLQDKCAEFEINIINDTILDVATDTNGITELKGIEDSYSADFFVDCSGFRKVLINKLGAEWVDCTEYLPMNSAITFATPHIEGEELPSYTSATALSSGWVFRLPTQTRFGNGYIYCDKFITEEQALAEAEAHYGHKLNVGKRFKFGAGYLKNSWIKNCVGLGLAGSFIEPLEATSIGTSIQQAFGLATYLRSWTKDTPGISKIYNAQFEKVFTNIVDFVQLHYITKRDDSDFWKYCKTLKLTEFNENTLPIFKNNLPGSPVFMEPYILFRNYNWLLVLNGLELFNRQNLIEQWDNLIEDVRLEASVKLFLNKNKNEGDTPLGHQDAIDFILGLNDANN
jgi:hypothetical protein